MALNSNITRAGKHTHIYGYMRDRLDVSWKVYSSTVPGLQNGMDEYYSQHWSTDYGPQETLPTGLQRPLY